MPDRSFLNWPFFEDAHRELADALDAWTGSVLDPETQAEEEAEHDDAVLDSLCRRYVELLGEGGWLRNCVPEEYGGAVAGRLDVRRLCLMREGLARQSGLADFSFAMQGLGSGPITLFGDDGLKERYLPDVAAGKRLAAFALSEPEAGSNPAEMTTTATREGDHFVLNGKKTWISNAGLADQYVVFVRTGGAPGAKGISAIVVDADTPGFSISRRISLIAPHPLGELTFHDCRVPASNLIGDEGAGLKIALATLDVFRSTVGAAALGFARRALDEAVAWCAHRQIDGAPLGALQLPQAHIADAATDVDASALLIYRAAWTKDVLGTRVTREAAMAKLHATESAQRTIDASVQLHGGMGVVSGHPVEKLYRDVRALRIYEGASDIQKLIIARQTQGSLAPAPQEG